MKVEIPSNAVKITIELPDGSIVVHEKPKETPGILWMPKNGEQYYRTESDNSIRSCVWLVGDTDIPAYQIGNLFRTREEARNALVRRKFKWAIARRIAELNDGMKFPKCYFCYEFGALRVKPYNNELCFPREFLMKDTGVADKIQKDFTDNEIIDALFSLS